MSLITDFEGKRVIEKPAPTSITLRHLPSTPLPEVIELPPEVGWPEWDSWQSTQAMGIE